MVKNTSKEIYRCSLSAFAFRKEPNLYLETRKILWFDIEARETNNNKYNNNL